MGRSAGAGRQAGVEGWKWADQRGQGGRLEWRAGNGQINGGRQADET
ncbi:hypothetical protein [Metabacillus sp. 84]